MVFERSRRAERCHHSVARELLDRSAGALDFLQHCVVEAVEQSSRRAGLVWAAASRFGWTWEPGSPPGFRGRPKWARLNSNEGPTDYERAGLCTHLHRDANVREGTTHDDE